MASLEAERQRQIELCPMTQAAQTTSSDRGMDPLCDAFRDGAIGGPLSPTVRSNNSSKSSRNAMTMNFKSNDMHTLSMEYSVDESALLASDKSIGEYTFDSTLVGQNFAADSKSVMSAATNKTFATKDILEEVPEDGQSSIGTDSTDSTTADDEQVPGDEELFAAGWAKALDPSSDSYYYFTLDRKQTVWDNPLAPQISQTNSEDSSSSSVGEI